MRQQLEAGRVLETNYQTYNRSIYKVRALSFNELELEVQSLYIVVNQDNLRIAVINQEDARCWYIEEFALNSKEDTVVQLQEIFEAHAFLKAGYWKNIKIATAEGLFTLIPNELFDSFKEPVEYLNLQLGAKSNKELKTIPQNKVDATNIFVFSEEVMNFFKETYPQTEIVFTHYTQVFTDAVLAQHQENEGVHVFVEHAQVLITYIKEGQLIFCNTFSYRAYEDLLYYVMLVLDEQNLDNKQIEVYLYGKTSTGSKLFDLLQKYIKHLKFVEEKPNWLKFDSNFDDTLAHSYFDLFGFYIS